MSVLGFTYFEMMSGLSVFFHLNSVPRQFFRRVLWPSLLLAGGCMHPVEDLKPTSFSPKELNHASAGRLVQIIYLMPARAAVDNSYNHYLAADLTGAAFGGLFGIVGIALGGADTAFTGFFLGSALGGLIGGAAVPPELHPQSLIIAYQDPNVPGIKQVIEIAKPCEFSLGYAYAVKVHPKSKREQLKIQPNNLPACLKKAKQLKADKKAGIRYRLTKEDIESQTKVDWKRLLRPTGWQVIEKLSAPQYHMPAFLETPAQKSAKNPAFSKKSAPKLTKKQLRILNKHKMLEAETFPSA